MSSSVTITEITEIENNNKEQEELSIEDKEIADLNLPDNIVIAPSENENGDDTDIENSEDDKRLSTTSEGLKKKKKKLRRELSNRIKENVFSSSDEALNKIKKDGFKRIKKINENESSDEKTKNEVDINKNKNIENKSVIRKRIINKNIDKNDRIKRGKSEPKDTIENDIKINNNSKPRWWLFNKIIYNKNDSRQIQTDGELKNNESSDEFWKSSSFKKRKNNKSDKNINKTDLKSITSNLKEIKNDNKEIKTDVKDSIKESDVKVVETIKKDVIISKEILTDNITFEIIKDNSEDIKELKQLTWKEFKTFNEHEYKKLIKIRNKCIALTITLILYLGCGALIIRFIEGTFENLYKCGVKRVKRDFIDVLWNKRYEVEDEWKSTARRTLMQFENELQNAFEAGIKSYSGQQSWTFINSFLYCLTVVTTIGYGNISPSTNTGRAFTIAYAIFGIPIFLIVLADFGKLFTRGIKFLWAYVRRLYYTGSCRKVRRTAPVQEVMKGVKLVCDVAQNLRRPSQVVSPEEQRRMTAFAKHLETPGTGAATPALSTYEIDEEFNLPISVALIILLGYIFLGASVFCIWESWSFFDSFYFVFISMSTIGFGDVVPQHQMYMMASIVYLMFGLALTSMCINVVQEKLSDSFRQASAKIGATIGFQVQEDTGEVNPVPAQASEIPAVHQSSKSKKS